MPKFTRAALLVVDVQKAIDAAYHAAEGPRNNPGAEKNIGRRLERYLRESRLDTLVITGVSTNSSVEATVRMAGNLGFQSYLVADACFTFARRDFHGRLRTADEVHSMSLANLHEEYCTVLDTEAVLADG